MVYTLSLTDSQHKLLMADKDDVVEEGEEKVNDKHNWGAADLEKVTDHQEEKDDVKLSSDALGKLMTGTQVAQKVVNIKKDDLLMIMNELELPKVTVEKKLIEVNGDPRAALRSLMGL